MNFGMLKSTVENIVSAYKCPFCNGTNIGEKNIDIVGAAGNTVNIDMLCPSCNKHFMAKTEVVQLDSSNLTREKLGQIQESLSALKGKLGGSLDVSSEILDKNTIKDENITGLQKQLRKKDFTIDDLFSQ